MRTRILKIIGTISALIYFALNDDDSKIQQLTPHEREIITVAADTFFPEGGPIPLSGTQAGVPEYVENTFNNAPDYHKKFMHLLFHFIELIALFRYATLFTLLHNPKKQKKVLDFTDMFIYFRRVAFMSLRQLCTMGYLANRKVGKQIGYLKDSPDIPASRD